MDYKLLENIGMSQSEIKAYLSCLELGLSTPAQIASHSKLNRSNCYDALDRLLKKGIVGKIVKNGKIHYEACKPQHLLEIIEKNKNDLASIVPDLEKIQQSLILPTQNAAIFEGYDGIKNVFENILNTLQPNEEFLVFGAVDTPPEFERYIVHWTRRRADKKIKLRIIYHEEAKNFLEQTKKMPFTRIKTMPKQYVTPAAVNIYGNKTATIVWSKTPIAFVVESEDYTNSFKNYFEMLWQQANQ